MRQGESLKVFKVTQIFSTNRSFYMKPLTKYCFRATLIVKYYSPWELSNIYAESAFSCYQKFRVKIHIVYTHQDVPLLDHTDTPQEGHTKYSMLCHIKQINRHSKGWSTGFKRIIFQPHLSNL